MMPLTVDPTITLSRLFHTYDPPMLVTSGSQRTGVNSRQSATCTPSTALFNILARLPRATLKVTHSHVILSQLSTLLSESWADDVGQQEIGSLWEMKIRSDQMLARDTIRGEVVDLNAAFQSFLFAPVNLVADRGSDYLKPEAYPPAGSRTGWGSSVTRSGLSGADAAAWIRRDGENSLAREADKIAMERKTPDSVPLDPLLNGVRDAQSREAGFTFSWSAVEELSTLESLDTRFVDSLLQVSFYPSPCFILLNMTGISLMISIHIRHSNIWTDKGSRSAC